MVIVSWFCAVDCDMQMLASSCYCLMIYGGITHMSSISIVVYI